MPKAENKNFLSPHLQQVHSLVVDIRPANDVCVYVYKSSYHCMYNAYKVAFPLSLISKGVYVGYIVWQFLEAF